tara:strand:- start:107 stop:517 length:411 start_codon:yes stop_codon:yes gene_type:complete
LIQNILLIRFVFDGKIIFHSGSPVNEVICKQHHPLGEPLFQICAVFRTLSIRLGSLRLRQLLAPEVEAGRGNPVLLTETGNTQAASTLLLDGRPPPNRLTLCMIRSRSVSLSPDNSRVDDSIHTTSREKTKMGRCD